ALPGEELLRAPALGPGHEAVLQPRPAAGRPDLRPLGETSSELLKARSGGPFASLRSHSETCAGWTACVTTALSSARTASRSSSSRKREPKAAGVSSAS